MQPTNEVKKNEVGKNEVPKRVVRQDEIGAWMKCRECGQRRYRKLNQVIECCGKTKALRLIHQGDFMVLKAVTQIPTAGPKTMWEATKQFVNPYQPEEAGRGPISELRDQTSLDTNPEPWEVGQERIGRTFDGRANKGLMPRAIQQANRLQART